MQKHARAVDSYRLPDFLVIGPQKAGTSWVHRYFVSRADVDVPGGGGETFYFDRRYYRGIGWYARQFHRAEDNRHAAEVGPSYFHCHKAPKRIVAALGSIQLICTLRHPAKRAFSLYLHLRRFGQTRAGFREAVEEHPLILDSSRYATHLKRWIDVFGEEKILVLFQETLAEDPRKYVRKLCTYLGLPFDGIDQSLNCRVNEAALPRNSYVAQYAKGLSDLIRSVGLYGVVEAAKKLGLREVLFGRPGTVQLPSLSNDDCAWFTSQLEDEMVKLEELLGIDLAHWKAVDH